MTQRTAAIIDAIGGLVGGERAADIAGASERMATAESEIERARRRWPDKDEALNSSFMLLCPSPMLAGVDTTGYRHHCRELLERVSKGQDTARPTRVELIMVLSSASLRSPLNDVGIYLMSKLFVEIYGGVASAGLADITATAEDSLVHLLAAKSEIEEMASVFRAKMLEKLDTGRAG